MEMLQGRVIDAQSSLCVHAKGTGQSVRPTLVGIGLGTLHQSIQEMNSE